MVQFTISSTKNFLNAFLRTELFDSFYLSEAQIVTFNTYHIDGRLKKEFFQDIQEAEEAPLRPYSLWGENRSFCFDLIKGRRVPLQLKFVLLLSEDQLSKLLSSKNLSMQADAIAGCFLNISYADGTLSCTSGTSLKQFSLDRSLDTAWDKALEQFLSLHEFI